jgi:transposase-like protein
MPTLNEPHFQDATKAREYLEAIRWPDGPICPHCGSVSKGHYALSGKAHRPGVYKCKDCREQFTVTVGTVFERSKVPLHQWTLMLHKFRLAEDLRRLAVRRGIATTPLAPPNWRTC